MKKLSETAILKRYSQPPGDPPDENEEQANNSIEPFPSSPIDYPPDTFEKGIKRRHKNREVLIQWINDNLISQVDFGKIHFVEHCPYAHNGSSDLCVNPSHWSKPVLWKGGAEKILGILGLSVSFPNMNQFEMAAAHKQEINEIVLKCQIKTHAGTIIAEGVGARTIGQDGGVLNTCIKMCARASMIDATIRACGLTNIFVQNDAQGKPMPTRFSCNTDKLPYPEACNKHTDQHESIQTKFITHRQKDFIIKIAGRLGMTSEALNKRCKGSFGSTLKDLERHHASKLINQLHGQF
jgi:hypothetical protein